MGIAIIVSVVENTIALPTVLLQAQEMQKCSQMFVTGHTFMLLKCDHA